MPCRPAPPRPSPSRPRTPIAALRGKPVDSTLGVRRRHPGATLTPSRSAAAQTTPRTQCRRRRRRRPLHCRGERRPSRQ
ncbi:hypothetical protein E2C01_048471 [Portunus trituberculatus]|uniref:Uncharacterized protein n=1 Tax=Portunus trituberculatus TaxID=210409 RepID=A0A5B7G393_PORTR|nr:hypothetical protein [Portunus trituberculatus]